MSKPKHLRQPTHWQAKPALPGIGGTHSQRRRWRINRIHQARAEGLQAYDIARRMGLSKGYVERIMTGR